MMSPSEQQVCRWIRLSNQLKPKKCDQLNLGEKEDSLLKDGGEVFVCLEYKEPCRQKLSRIERTGHLAAAAQRMNILLRFQIQKFLMQLQARDIRKKVLSFF
jgi:hypothetical protein